MENEIRLVSAVVPGVFLMGCSNEDPCVNFLIKMKKYGNPLKSGFMYTKALVCLSSMQNLKSVKHTLVDQGERARNVFFDLVSGKTFQPKAMNGKPFKRVDVTKSWDGLGSNSITVLGKVRRGIKTYSFEFNSAMVGEFHVEHVRKGLFQERLNFVLYIDLDGLFASIDFSKAKMDEDKIIRINAVSNKTIYQSLESNLPNYFEFDDE